MWTIVVVLSKIENYFIPGPWRFFDHLMFSGFLSIYDILYMGSHNHIMIWCFTIITPLDRTALCILSAACFTIILIKQPFHWMLLVFVWICWWASEVLPSNSFCKWEETEQCCWLGDITLERREDQWVFGTVKKCSLLSRHNSYRRRAVLGQKCLSAAVNVLIKKTLHSITAGVTCNCIQPGSTVSQSIKYYYYCWDSLSSNVNMKWVCCRTPFCHVIIKLY